MTEIYCLKKVLKNTDLIRHSLLKWSTAMGGTIAIVGGLNGDLETAKKTFTEFIWQKTDEIIFVYVARLQNPFSSQLPPRFIQISRNYSNHEAAS